jgi:hypothetical protein
MLASDFVGPPARRFPPAARALSYGLLYGVLVPVARGFEAFGKWPEVAVRRIAKAKGSFAGYQAGPLARRIDDNCRSELRNLNCDFPYDDAFRLA